MENKKILQLLKKFFTPHLVVIILVLGTISYAGIPQKSSIGTLGTKITTTGWNNFVADITALNALLDQKVNNNGGNIVADLPIANEHAATKAYVDAQNGGFDADTTGCTATSPVSLRWSANAEEPKYGCYDTDPNNFDFIDQSNTTLNILVTSNIAQITGISSDVPVKINGVGNPQFRICSDDICSDVIQNWNSDEINIYNNKYLQLRLSSNSCSVQNYANVTIGNTVDVWQVYLDCPGQIAYTTPGTYSWTAPAHVTSVSVVAVGGGGGGSTPWSNHGGAGGGLGWKNNIPVVPGQSYTVEVGAGGTYSSSPTLGNNSYFIDTSTVAGFGAGRGGTGSSSTGVEYGGGYTGDGGGRGGNATSTYHAGGAGGYTGQGGDSINNPGQGGGGGSPNAYSSTYGSGGGGGVGLLGQGANGLAGNSIGTGAGGGGGSGGQNGSYGEPSSPGMGAIYGGAYGGGGGGGGSSYGGGNGGRGAVRIIWGSGRAFPTTNTGDY